MEITRGFCVHPTPREGQECNKCFHLVPHCDPDDPEARTLYATQVRLMWQSRTPTLAEPGISLCERCESMTLDKICSEEGYIHSACYWALLASAEASRCPMCVIMVDVLRGSRDQAFDYSVALENPYQDNRYIRIRAVPKEGRWQKLNMEVEVMNRILNPTRPERLCMAMESGAKATEHETPQKKVLHETQNFDAIRQWLHLQNLEHRRVQKSMPTRVLDLEPPEGGIKLVERYSMASRYEAYMALSYRWGEGNHLTTTLETLANRRKGIRLEDMPKTIQDAVIVTRQLKVRYLWIDALCIIQNDATDWSDEAKGMGEIYMNAYCTIAAHAARHANDGFLEKSMTEPRMIQLGGGSGAGNSFWVSRGVNQRHQIADSELSSRGWVLQERILSQRMIHFADDGVIYLESTLGMHTLDGTITVGAPLRSGGIRSMIERDVLQGNAEIEDENEEVEKISLQIYRDWYSLVWLYSLCFLTKPEDKIPALTGIINQIQKFNGDRCFMGVWQQRVHQGLLWVRGPQKLQRVAPSRGPSWSWVAYDGLVGFPKWNITGDDRKIQAEFAGIEFDCSNDAGGNPDQPGLRVRGAKMLRNFAFTTLDSKGGTGLRFLDPQTADPSTVNVVLWEPLKCPTRFWHVADDSSENIGWASFDEEEGGDFDGEDVRVTCIAIASHSDDRPGWKRGFLVLFVNMTNAGCFRRVGMGQILKTDLFERIMSRDIYII